MSDPYRIGYDTKYYLKLISYKGPSPKDVKVRTVKPMGKSLAWHAATWTHYNNHISPGICKWCLGFERFNQRYFEPDSQSVSSSLEQDPTLESMKK